MKKIFRLGLKALSLLTLFCSFSCSQGFQTYTFKEAPVKNFRAFVTDGAILLSWDKSLDCSSVYLERRSASTGETVCIPVNDRCSVWDVASYDNLVDGEEYTYSITACGSINSSRFASLQDVFEKKSENLFVSNDLDHTYSSDPVSVTVKAKVPPMGSLLPSYIQTSEYQDVSLQVVNNRLFVYAPQDFLTSPVVTITDQNNLYSASIACNGSDGTGSSFPYYGGIFTVSVVKTWNQANHFYLDSKPVTLTVDASNLAGDIPSPLLTNEKTASGFPKYSWICTPGYEYVLYRAKKDPLTLFYEPFQLADLSKSVCETSKDGTVKQIFIDEVSTGTYEYVLIAKSNSKTSPVQHGVNTNTIYVDPFSSKIQKSALTVTPVETETLVPSVYLTWDDPEENEKAEYKLYRRESVTAVAAAQNEWEPLNLKIVRGVTGLAAATNTAASSSSVTSQVFNTAYAVDLAVKSDRVYLYDYKLVTLYEGRIIYETSVLKNKVGHLEQAPKISSLKVDSNQKNKIKIGIPYIPNVEDYSVYRFAVSYSVQGNSGSLPSFVMEQLGAERIHSFSSSSITLKDSAFPYDSDQNPYLDVILEDEALLYDSTYGYFLCVTYSDGQKAKSATKIITTGSKI